MTDPIRKITTKAGEIRYRFVIDVGPKGSKQRKQETHTFRTMKEARAAPAKIISDRDQNKLVKRDKITFDELCQHWLDSRHDVREVSVRELRSAIATFSRHREPSSAKVKVQDLTRSDVEAVIRSLAERDLSHRAIVYTLGAVRQVLAYGITEGRISINVAASVKAPRKQASKAVADTRTKDEPWTPDELARFRAVADADEWAAAWRLTLCGLRRSEIMGLKWDAVDLDRGEVTIQAGRVLLDGHRTATDDPKSSASRRTVPVEELHPGTVALLRSLKARQAADRLLLGAGYPETGLVLMDAVGRPIRPERYSDQFRRLSRTAGLRPIHLHLVRHTLATAMVRAGIPIVDAAALLGHTPDVYVSTYLRKSEQGTRSAASALGVALAGSV